MSWNRIVPIAALCLAAGLGARAQEAQVPVDIREDMDAQARALVEAVLGGSGEDVEDLAGWADAVIGDALSDAGSTVTGPVPAEATRGLPGGGFAGAQAATAEVIVFASLSMPEASWRQWSRQAARIGTPLVLRGMAEGGLEATVHRIAARRGDDGAGATIDPRLFRLFRIAHVPAVAVVPGGVAPCESPGCSADPAPAHDLVTGNIGLEAALEAIAREGEPGRETARRHLGILRGESN
ncbi:MAG: type-F conjugative transfer system pilin assembly protein TrbC [Rhodospirillales bacterium]|nr:type-F conjugative transfer system pilin assembly protein TrbC [Rhodospirillales bacterium]